MHTNRSLMKSAAIFGGMLLFHRRRAGMSLAWSRGCFLPSYFLVGRSPKCALFFFRDCRQYRLPIYCDYDFEHFGCGGIWLTGCQVEIYLRAPTEVYMALAEYPTSSVGWVGSSNEAIELADC
jgi:hypothetical protein